MRSPRLPERSLETYSYHCQVADRILSNGRYWPKSSSASRACMIPIHSQCIDRPNEWALVSPILINLPSTDTLVPEWCTYPISLLTVVVFHARSLSLSNTTSSTTLFYISSLLLAYLSSLVVGTGLPHFIASVTPRSSVDADDSFGLSIHSFLTWTLFYIFVQIQPR
jgi:hypothetical protein